MKDWKSIDDQLTLLKSRGIAYFQAIASRFRPMSPGKLNSFARLRH
ncbi:hypothetical protein LX82_03145 [Celeribacter halophilus]|uniref:Transposase n=1 Tax=Celeribacter halophilus TaxID=576117 RepID=A0A1I3VSS6_9RHOB|nr:hypothetical protein LX82_03145 [Celeribacter halophilus]SFJ98458.1 hypothetical protein SAMN04488138_11769 [Celeribacter halophilus]